jgi:hypothetical protein
MQREAPLSRRTQQPKVDPKSFTLYTQEDFYTAEDREAAAHPWPRDEIERAFGRYRAAVDVGDHDAMASMLTEDGRGGNATFGFFHGQAAYRKFLGDCWLEIVPNYSVWQAIEGGRVLDKWCEVLPGRPPAGGRYDYFGINEVIYAGDGRFRLMYSLPDLFGLSLLYRRWKADGQHQQYGDLYPGLSD